MIVQSANTVKEVLSVLEKIIKLTSHQSGTDMVKLSRWLRCLFNLALTFDESISYRCTDQAVKLATTRHRVSPFSLFSHIRCRAIVKPRQDTCVAKPAVLHTPPPSSKPIRYENEVLADNAFKGVDRYPPTELEWLATSAFNHAVDYYLQDNDKDCKRWAEQAFVLAQWLEDDGTLRDLLMEKYASLKLQT
jgi:hypothetical protein